MQLSRRLLFKTLNETLKFQEKPKTNTFSSNLHTYISKILLCGHPTKPLNQARTKKTESLVKYGCRQKFLDKSLNWSPSISA